MNKGEIVQNAYSDHFAIKHFKFNMIKIKDFIKNDLANDTKEKSASAITEASKNIEKSSVVKRSNKVEGSGHVNKKVKYDSPLDFLKVQKNAHDDDGSGDKYDIKIILTIIFKFFRKFLKIIQKLFNANYFRYIIY